MNLRLGVIGAGSAAAAATHVIGTSHPGVEITVFEKSRGVCGRAATRRRTAGERQYVYDYGANYLTDDDPRVNALVTDALADGLVEVDGPIWTFDAAGNVSEGRDADKHRWTYVDGITRLAKHLFEQAGVAVRQTTRIVDVTAGEGTGPGAQARPDGAPWTAEGWCLTDADGQTHGPFDALLLNPPAPQTAHLLRATGVGAADQLGAAAEAVEYRTVWTAVLGYEFSVEAPYYALVNADKEHAVGWIGREERKPGHVPDGESVLVVQANAKWSAKRYDEAPDDNIAALARHAADVVGEGRLAAPDWSDWQGWRYALPEGAVEREALREAARSGVYAAGDWVAGEARLHAAVRSGLKTGERIVRALNESPASPL